MVKLAAAQGAVEILSSILALCRLVAKDLPPIIDEAIERFDSLHHSCIELRHYGYSIRTEARKLVNCTYAYVDRINDLFFYGSRRDIQRIKTGIENDNFEPLKNFIDDLCRYITNADHKFKKFKKAFETVKTSCTQAALECNHKAIEATSKKTATKAIGGVASGVAIVGGVGTGVVLSVVAGIFTFGIGAVVGLSLTAAGTIVAGTTVGAAGAIGTHLLSSNFEDDEKKLSSLADTYDQLLRNISDKHNNCLKLRMRLESLLYRTNEISEQTAANRRQIDRQDIFDALDYLVAGFEKNRQESSELRDCLRRQWENYTD